MINTVWIYVDTSKEVGDKDHLKVFTSEEAANAWFAERDPEVVAFENEPLTRGSLASHNVYSQCFRFRTAGTNRASSKQQCPTGTKIQTLLSDHLPQGSARRSWFVLEPPLLK